MPETFLVNGSPVSRPAAGVVISHVCTFAKGSMPSLSFAIRGGPLINAATDPYRNARIDFTEAGGNYLFSGNTQHVLTHYEERLGWVREYACLGLAKRADHIPVTDEVSLTDTSLSAPTSLLTGTVSRSFAATV